MYSEQILADITRHYGDWFLENEWLEKGQMSSDLYPYQEMFKPIKVNRLTLKNRLVMAPMGNISMAEETGRPSEQMIAYFAERAKGGVGLITTGLIPVTFDVDPSLSEPGDLTYFPKILGSRTHFSGWRDLAAGCHAHDCKVFIQLTAGLGRVGNPECLVHSYKFPVSASWNPNYYLPAVPCRRLSNRKIRRIIRNMGQAAADAQVAQLDGVYLHGHEGYLIEQLTNRAFNRRKIGPYSDWQRFGIDMVKEIRKRAGDHFPIMYRIDLSLALNVTFGEKMNQVKSLKKFRNERKIAETLDYMQNLVKAGVDIFDLDLGCYDNWWLPHPPYSMPPGPFLEVAELAKKYFAEHQVLSNQGLEVPVVAVGKLGYPDLAEDALRAGKADMIMLGRPLLADPQWPNKVYRGDVASIRPCIGCQDACINEFVEGGHPTCAVNPRTAFEHVMPELPPLAERRKKIAVVGAGPAGIECALAALDRGHEVYLFDQADRVGGVVKIGSLPKIKFDIANYLAWLQRRVEEVANYESRFHLHLNTVATASMLEDNQFDTIVVATGAKPQPLPIPGAERAVFAQTLMENRELAEDLENIVIVGAGSVGVELAYALAYEDRKHVTIVEMLPYAMKDVCTANRGHLLHYLQQAGVKLYNCSKVKEILPGQVKIEVNRDKNVPDPYTTWTPVLPENVHNPFAKKIAEDFHEETLTCDLAVIAAGYQPDQELYDILYQNRIAPQVIKLGDCDRPGTVKHAVRSGYRLGVSL